MTELESRFILHQIELGRVENGIIKKCLEQLEKANRLIKEELRKTDSVGTKARYNEIRKQLKQIAKELKENLDEDMSVSDFIEFEAESQMKLFKKYGGINLKLPTIEQLVTTATFSPYTATSSFANYLESFEYNFFNVWDSTVRSGYLTGMTTPQIIRKVMGYPARDSKVADYGVMQSLRNSIETNTRTALQSFATETRNQMYKKNNDLFNGYKWLATLDRKTCIICGSKEGKIYSSLEKIDRPPVHLNCRCTVIPYIKDMEEIEMSRSSDKGYVGNITYEEWLENQSEEVQKDVLGEYRYERYKKGENIKSFVADNRILTIDELRKKEE